MIRYDLPNKFNKLKTNHFPTIDFLIDNLRNDKKCLSLGNRFVLSEKLGIASTKVINDDELIRNAYNILY